MNDPTRRQAIKTLASLAAIALLPRVSLADTQSVLHAFSEYIKVIRPSDSDFATILDLNFPGLSSRKRFKKSLASAAIVINTGAKSIYGFTFRWSATSAHGYSVKYSRTFARRPTVFLDNRHKTARARFLRPGEIALVTPLFLWRAKNYTINKAKYRLTQTKFREYASRHGRAHGMTLHLRNAVSTEFSVQSIAFRASVIGPGSSKTSRKLRNEQNAEHDEARYLLSLINTHAIGSEAFSTAATQSYSSNLYRASQGQHKSYYMARARFALKVRLAAQYRKHVHVLRVLHKVARSKKSMFLA